MVLAGQHRNLVSFLRKGAKGHEGTPFTSKDVKYTFDMVREAPDAPGKLRINPRKDWYNNVEAIEAAGIAISLAVFGSNLLGDALRDSLDPRLRGAQ